MTNVNQILHNGSNLQVLLENQVFSVSDQIWCIHPGFLRIGLNLVILSSSFSVLRVIFQVSITFETAFFNTIGRLKLVDLLNGPFKISFCTVISEQIYVPSEIAQVCSVTGQA